MWNGWKKGSKQARLKNILRILFNDLNSSSTTKNFLRVFGLPFNSKENGQSWVCAFRLFFCFKVDFSKKIRSSDACAQLQDWNYKQEKSIKSFSHFFSQQDIALTMEVDKPQRTPATVEIAIVSCFVWRIMPWYHLFGQWPVLCPIRCFILQRIGCAWYSL
jgi:hypothetical protein